MKLFGKSWFSNEDPKDLANLAQEIQVKPLQMEAEISKIPRKLGIDMKKVKTGQVFTSGEYPNYLDIKEELEDIEKDLTWITGVINKKELEDRKEYLVGLITLPEVVEKWEKVSDAQNFESEMSFNPEQKKFLHAFTEDFSSLVNFEGSLYASPLVGTAADKALQIIRRDREKALTIITELNSGDDMQQIKALRQVIDLFGNLSMLTFGTGTKSAMAFQFGQHSDKNIKEVASIIFPGLITKIVNPSF